MEAETGKKCRYTIGEAADIIGESVSLVRFWTERYPMFLHPKRNAKGNRLYSPEDVDTLRQLHFLIKEKGTTLDGAEKELGSSKMAVEARVKVLDALKALRSNLVEIKKNL